MAIPNILKERKYPFIASLFILLIFGTFLLISNVQSPSLSASSVNLEDPSSSSSSSLMPVPLIPPSSLPDPSSSTTNSTSSSSSSSDENQMQEDTEGWSWKACQSAGAVDYIPCLDNSKAIKAFALQEAYGAPRAPLSHPSPGSLPDSSPLRLQGSRSVA